MDEAVLLELAELDQRLSEIADRRRERTDHWNGKPYYRCQLVTMRLPRKDAT